jgi:hypothetical protein
MKLVKLSSIKARPHPVPSPLNGEKVRMRGEKGTGSSFVSGWSFSGAHKIQDF